jgi:predicted NBD/HSP70 family sugar kinase
LERVARWLGIGLAGLVNLLDPRLVVLGGWFGRMSPLIMDGVRRELDARALALTRAPVPVVPGRLGADAPLVGAAERALEPLLGDPLRYAPALLRRRKGAAVTDR